jgi:SnoaL-like domain
VTSTRNHETDLAQVLSGFCAGFEAKDPDAVLAVFSTAQDVTLITSEKHVLRGREALEQFLDVYAAGPTKYSWTWSQIETTARLPIGWLFAEGIETATTNGNDVRTAYRMTIVCELEGDRWHARLAHGSSPHVPDTNAAR